jgi:hypothetical protein
MAGNYEPDPVDIFVPRLEQLNMSYQELEKLHEAIMDDIEIEYDFREGTNIVTAANGPWLDWVVLRRMHEQLRKRLLLSSRVSRDLLTNHKCPIGSPTSTAQSPQDVLLGFGPGPAHTRARDLGTVKSLSQHRYHRQE